MPARTALRKTLQQHTYLTHFAKAPPLKTLAYFHFARTAQHCHAKTWRPLRLHTDTFARAAHAAGWLHFFYEVFAVGAILPLPVFLPAAKPRLPYLPTSQDFENFRRHHKRFINWIVSTSAAANGARSQLHDKCLHIKSVIARKTWTPCFFFVLRNKKGRKCRNIPNALASFEESAICNHHCSIKRCRLVTQFWTKTRSHDA
jgi:hypothetical protein